MNEAKKNKNIRYGMSILRLLVMFAFVINLSLACEAGNALVIITNVVLCTAFAIYDTILEEANLFNADKKE